MRIGIRKRRVSGSGLMTSTLEGMALDGGAVVVDVGSSACGSQSVTGVPRPNSFSSRSAPPDCAAKPLAMDNPSPVPRSCGLVVKNGSAARASVAASIPTPVSAAQSRT